MTHIKFRLGDRLKTGIFQLGRYLKPELSMLISMVLVEVDDNLPIKEMHIYDWGEPDVVIVFTEHHRIWISTSNNRIILPVMGTAALVKYEYKKKYVKYKRFHKTLLKYWEGWL